MPAAGKARAWTQKRCPSKSLHAAWSGRLAPQMAVVHPLHSVASSNQQGAQPAASQVDARATRPWCSGGVFRRRACTCEGGSVAGDPADVPRAPQCTAGAEKLPKLSASFPARQRG
jgi:hypothetical protein